MQARSTAIAIATVCGLVFAPQLSSTADASPSRGGAKHVSASRQAAAPRQAQAIRTVRGTGAKFASRRSETREIVPASYSSAYSSQGYSSQGSISCVPYARMVTGMDVSGNGGTWWNNAAGTYQRGSRPEAGSVLVFRSSGGMRSGHVAVVLTLFFPA